MLDKKDASKDYSCSLCLNWCLDCDSDLLNYAPPDKYPPEMVPLRGYLQPIKLDFVFLRNKVKRVHVKMKNGEWDEAKADVYLSTICINKVSWKEII